MVFTAFLIIMLILSAIFMVIITSAFLGFLFTRVPFVPTNKEDVECFVKKLSLGSKDVFYDLGSGNGKVVFIVNKITGAKCKGFELTWWAHLLARINLWQKKRSPFSLSLLKRGLGGVQFKNQNFFKHPWDEATVIYGYLYPPLMARVEEKFLKDCKPGTFAVIRDFPFPNLKPLEIIKRPKSHELYIYLK